MVAIYDAEATALGLPWEGLIDGLARMFVKGCEMPVRHHHSVGVPDEADGTILLMPAWVPGGHIGVKLVTVIPGNSSRGLPAIAGTYVLSSGRTGKVLAMIDGAELTARRTAAASALAARYLARDDAARLLVVGAGKLSLNLIEAHSTVLPITSVQIWARRAEQAEAVAEEARARGFNARATGDIEAAAREADLISCCTLSRAPLILGDWLKPGAHLDLIGAFRPDMRECDDAAVLKARVFADTRAGVLAEGGDILQPIRAGLIDESHIHADLFDLCRGVHPGRGSGREITLFKSVGAALEDLAAAVLLHTGI